MTILEELLVRLGVDMTGAERDLDGSADRITQGLDSVSADGMARKIDQGADQAITSLDGVGESARDLGVDAEAGAAGVEGALGGIGGMAAGAAVGALFMEGLSSAMDMKSATAALENSLGLTEAEAARAGDIAGDVFSAGFGESIGAVTEALGGVSSAMGGLAEMTDAELQQMTTSAIAFADTVKMDVADASNMAGKMIKQGLVKDGTEAFDVLTRAAQVLPETMIADLPDLVAEYGTHFKRIGLDAQTAFGMMSQFVQAGGKDIDQAGDVLHEFARITSEESARAADGFKALGLDANTMLTDIGKGGKPAADALGLTLDALRGVKDPAKQAELGVALFGDMAGEAAGALLAMNPATAASASGMDQAAGAAQRVTDSMAASPGQQFESIMRTLSMTLGELLLPALNFIAGLMQEHPALIQALVPVLLSLAAGLAIATAAQWAMNSAVLANPYTWIVVAVVALIAAIILLWQNWDSVTKWMGDAWGWLVDQFWGGWSWLVNNVFNPIGRFFTSTIPGWVGSGVNWIVDKWNGMIGWFAGIPGRLAKAGSGMWSFITDGLKGALNGAIGIVNDGIFSINANLIGNANRIPGVNIPYIPYVPFLAEGGITTGPTMAMIGEGSEQEAVMPLSKLQNLLDVSAMQSVSRHVQPAEDRRVWELRGGSRAFREFFQESVRDSAGGDVFKYVEG
ncbi:phage tail tape measure protein [Streptomyces sp. NBC_00827]|uniref:phage tail tape measure protein n=1 Tax=Streptomyces sp. NBC_00827 TaxID=2903677 RepID=UPI0038662247|nr:phage tail tape measure protein [Streptomyces sp. NBC_00827]